MSNDLSPDLMLDLRELVSNAASCIETKAQRISVKSEHLHKVAGEAHALLEYQARRIALLEQQAKLDQDVNGQLEARVVELERDRNEWQRIADARLRAVRALEGDLRNIREQDGEAARESANDALTRPRETSPETRASSECPICGTDTPHRHSATEVCVHLQNIAATFHHSVEVFDKTEHKASIDYRNSARGKFKEFVSEMGLYNGIEYAFGLWCDSPTGKQRLAELERTPPPPCADCEKHEANYRAALNHIQTIQDELNRSRQLRRELEHEIHAQPSPEPGEGQ